MPGEVWLVLDDQHLVEHPVVATGLTFLVDHLPAQVHLVLSTRADPDLPLSRWRVRGELVEMRAADLRFSTDEAADYLAGATGVRLSAEQARALTDRTEGWIAALQLAAISLQGRDRRRGFIAGFAGDDRYVFDYLVEEVLAHQPPDVREFLLGSAVLDRLTGPLCDAVVDGVDAGAMLPALERANLFLVALDDRREWFRYHQLFADVLRARLRGERPELVPVLHERASQLVRASRTSRSRRCSTRWRPTTSNGPPAGGAGPFRRSAGSAARRSWRAGSPHCPTTPCGAARC